mgnify:CR=1 FL=1
MSNLTSHQRKMLDQFINAVTKALELRNMKSALMDIRLSDKTDPDTTEIKGNLEEDMEVSHEELLEILDSLRDSNFFSV